MNNQTIANTPIHHDTLTASHYYALTACVVLGHMVLVWAFVLNATQTPPKQKTTPIQIELQHITQTIPQKTDTPWNNPPKPQTIKPKDSRPMPKTHPSQISKATTPPKKPPKPLPPKKHLINQVAKNTSAVSEAHLPMPQNTSSPSGITHTKPQENLNTQSNHKTKAQSPSHSTTPSTPTQAPQIIQSSTPNAQDGQDTHHLSTPSTPTQAIALQDTPQHEPSKKETPPPEALTEQATKPTPHKPNPNIVKDWQAKVRLAIEQKLHYPPQALANQWQGKCLLQITIDDLGRVIDVSLAKSSGKTLLDNEAIATAKRASPLPKPPSELIQNNRLSFVIPINFNHKKYP